jgi:hypothetical protein
MEPNLVRMIEDENIFALSKHVNEKLYSKSASGLENITQDVCKSIADGDPIHEGLVQWISSTVDSVSRSMKARGFSKKLRSIINDTIGELKRLSKAVRAKDIDKTIVVVQTLGRDHLPQIIAHIEVLQALSQGQNIKFDIPDDTAGGSPNQGDWASNDVEGLLAASYNMMTASMGLVSLHEQELSPEQKAYKALFDKIIAKYDGDSPNDLSDAEKKKFFNELEAAWSKHPDNKKDDGENQEDEEE